MNGTKIGPNDPCPCGSGAKYKKCCRARDLESQLPQPGEADASARPAAAPAAPTVWTPFGDRCPTRYLMPRESLRYLSLSQMDFMCEISRLHSDGSPAAAAQGLWMLETVPEREQRVMPGMKDYLAHFLETLGRTEEAFEVTWEHLVSVDDEPRWVQRGNRLLDWFLEHEAGPEVEAKKAQLREVCARVDFAAPKLLLAYTLFADRLPPEAAALLSVALRPERWGVSEYIERWFVLLARGFYYYVAQLQAERRDAEARRYGQMILRFPWERGTSRLETSELKLLGSTLISLQMPQELTQLCLRIRRREPTWPEVQFYLGLAAQLSPRDRKAVEHYREALRLGGLETLNARELTAIAQALYFNGVGEEALPVVERLLELGEAAEDAALELPEPLELKLGLLMRLERWGEALEVCDQLGSQGSKSYFADLCRIHVLQALERRDDLEAHLRALMGDPEPGMRDTAALHLGRLLLEKDEPAQALEVLEPLLAGDRQESLIFVQSRHNYLVYLGEALYRVGRREEAAERYRQALQILPAEPATLRLLELLVELGRFDEAEAWAQQALQTYPDSRDLAHAALAVHAHFGQWPRCVELLERIGLAWFEEQGMLDRGLQLWARALVSTGSPFDALALCEDHLARVAASEELLQMHGEILESTRAAVARLQASLGAQELQVAELRKTQEALSRQIERSRIAHRDLKRAFREQERAGLEAFVNGTLRSGRQAGEAPPAGSPRAEEIRLALAASHPEVMAALPEHLRTVLVSAELLWATLGAQPDDDHGPVALQLARVVEGEVNRLLIDPLVGIASAREGGLAELSTMTRAAIMPDKNRLSLGEAARLLYTRIDRRLADGSTSTLINPYSGEHHRRALEALQAAFEPLPTAVARYLREDLPLDLQDLARLRNRASHAGAPISRRDAEPARAMVLGRGARGLLPCLACLARAQPLEAKPG